MVGVPLSFNDLLLPEGVAVMPAGKAPDEIAHLYGVQPPLACTVAEYAVPTVPLGKVVLLMLTDAKQGTERSRRRAGPESFMAPCWPERKSSDRPSSLQMKVLNCFAYGGLLRPGALSDRCPKPAFPGSWFIPRITGHFEAIYAERHCLERWGF